MQAVRLMQQFKMPAMTKTFITNNVRYIDIINRNSSSPFFFQAGINAMYAFLAGQDGRVLKDVDKI